MTAPSRRKFQTAEESPEVTRRNEALASMSPELRKEYDEIVKEVRDQAGSNVFFYHQLGQRAEKIRSESSKYGEGAIDKLSDALLIDRSMIYKALTFGQQYSRADLNFILAESTAQDHVFTWSHFAQLLPIEDKQQRQELIDSVIRRSMSTRELAEEIRKRIHHGKPSTRSAAPRSLMGGLSQMVSMSTRLLDKFDGDFQQMVFDSLDGIEDGEVSEKLIESVVNSEKAMQTLADHADRRARELEEFKLKLRKTAQRNERNKQQKEGEDSGKEDKSSSQSSDKPWRRRPIQG